MIDTDNIRRVVLKGLSDYLGIQIIRSNQTGKPPKYPYGSYTITMLMSENKGTYGEYDDGYDRKLVKQTWSLTFQSDDNNESLELACKAREWLDHFGNTYLRDNNVIVRSVGSITNRDNFLTIEYEYRNGFDVVFNLFDVINNPIDEAGYIETVSINGEIIEERPSTEEMLEEELDEAVKIIHTQNNALSRLNDRLEGVNSNE